MENFKNRTPKFPNRRTIKYSDGRRENVDILYADEPTKSGTPLNKVSLNKMQDLVDHKIVFNSNGSITQQYYDNSRLEIIFEGNGDIVEKYYNSNGVLELKNTTITESSGSIKVEVITYE